MIHLSGTNRKPLELKQDLLHRLGDTPVRVHGYECETSFAIAGCGSGLWWISHPEDRTPGFAIEKVWITNQADVSILLQSIPSGTSNRISNAESTSPPVRNPPSRHSAAWNHSRMAMATRVALEAHSYVSPSMNCSHATWKGCQSLFPDISSTLGTHGG
jgi:hypothetical protein